MAGRKDQVARPAPTSSTHRTSAGVFGSTVDSSEGWRNPAISMSDRITPSQRSLLMSGVRTKHTGPELKVRSVAHRAGFRFALHRRDLPGKPDIVVPRFKAAVFVNGCFWHQHEGCSKSSLPRRGRRFGRRSCPETSPGMLRIGKSFAGPVGESWSFGNARPATGMSSPTN